VCRILGGSQVFLISVPVGKHFPDLDRPAASLIEQKMRNPQAAGTSKQPQLPLTNSISIRIEQRTGIAVSRQPFRLGHDPAPV
jgi:hypothetical protein